MVATAKEAGAELLRSVSVGASDKPHALTPARDLLSINSALEAQIALYAAAIDTVEPAITAFDGEQRLVLCNRNYSALYHLAPEQIRPGMTLAELDQLCAGSNSAMARGIDDYLAFVRSMRDHPGARNWTAELKDGRHIRIRHEPAPDGGWVATHEACADAAALSAIKRESLTQALIDVVPDYLWAKNLQGRFVFVNAALASDSGYARGEDMIGLSDFDIHEPTAAAEFHAIEQQVLRSGKPLLYREETVVDARGVQKWLLSKKTPLRNESGEISGLVGIAHDITERVRAKSELRRAREFLNTVIENIPEAIIVKDVRDRRYIMINYAAEQLFSLPRAQILGKTAEALYPAPYVETVQREDEELLRLGELFIDNHTIELRGQESRIVTLTRKLLKDEKGVPQFMLAVIHDITDRKRAEERIEHLAHHDPLTDLPNRAAFNDRLARAIDKASLSKSRLAVLGIDLDRLMETNDIFGHAAGDQLLCEVSRRLLDAGRGSFLARVGGDEFALIVEGAELIADVEALTDRLLASVCVDLSIQGAHIRASVSIGAAVFPEDGGDATTLLGNADAALYRAKAEGRGVSRFFEREMDTQLRDRHALRHDLTSAIERGEFTMFYQPKAKLTGEFVGFEALIRWNHPTRGAVPPSEFIPVAEESGLIVGIGGWVLRDVCREAASWPLPLGVAVNLSPAQFLHGDLLRLVHSVLLETGLSADRLELEITEGVLIANSSRALSVLHQLKALGVRISMDDFGKGYSSLSYLQLFPFDKIKIDRDFISNVAQNRQSAAITRAILGLARGLGLRVLAEGVETEAERAFLAAEGCDEIQGYLIGRPQPIEVYAEAIGRPIGAAEPKGAAA